jgi:hypothetical protein
MNKVEQITIHFNDGSCKTIKKEGFVVYLEGDDLEANFFNMDSSEIKNMLLALLSSIDFAEKADKELLKQN